MTAALAPDQRYENRADQLEALCRRMALMSEKASRQVVTCSATETGISAGCPAVAC